MSVLTWDGTGQRYYETGVDRGVLYIPNSEGDYDNGVAWNGLTAITEKPSGAEANAQFADNIKYLNLFSAEEFGATLEAFTYPDEFAEFDGLAVPELGVTLGQQARKMFGIGYRSRVGNDIDGDDLGYKLHLIYGCKASPSEKAYTTINDSPEPITFSWEITTTPALVTDLKPTSIITIDSTKVDAEALTSLELVLYGDIGIDPRLPTPDEVVTFFSGTITVVTAEMPEFVEIDNEITIPVVSGVTYYINDIAVGGVITIEEDTLVVARPQSGYVLTPGTDDDWLFSFTP